MNPFYLAIHILLVQCLWRTTTDTVSLSIFPWGCWPFSYWSLVEKVWVGFMERRKGLKRAGGREAARLCLCSRSEVHSSVAFLELNRFFFWIVCLQPWPVISFSKRFIIPWGHCWPSSLQLEKEGRKAPFFEFPLWPASGCGRSCLNPWVSPRKGLGGPPCWVLVFTLGASSWTWATGCGLSDLEWPTHASHSAGDSSWCCPPPAGCLHTQPVTTAASRPPGPHTVLGPRARGQAAKEAEDAAWGWGFLVLSR